MIAVLGSTFDQTFLKLRLSFFQSIRFIPPHEHDQRSEIDGTDNPYLFLGYLVSLSYTINSEKYIVISSHIPSNLKGSRNIFEYIYVSVCMKFREENNREKYFS